MRHVSLDLRFPDADAATVFNRISDYPRYTDYTDAVREIRIDRREGNDITSTWTVNFRNGVLCWTERDRMDPVRLNIDFEQLTGDFAVFTGTWRVEQIGAEVEVRFTADFDLGMPSLAAIIDPIAEDALLENIRSILRGLLGDAVSAGRGDAATLTAAR